MIDLPTVEHPRQVPMLRNWMIRHFSEGGEFGFLEEADFIRYAVPRAQLWWVEPGACDVLAEAAPTLPTDHALSLDELPAPYGLVVFAHDLIGHDAYPDAAGREVNVSAVVWSLGRLPPIDGVQRDGVSFMMFSRIDLGDRQHPMRPAFEFMFSPTDLHGVLYAYIGRTDWIDTWTVDEVIADNPHGFDPTANLSMAEDRRLMASLWALAKTPVMRVAREQPDRAEFRRAERKGMDSSVRVLTLHGPTVGPSETTGSGGREWRHQWVVRPHWTHQPYGPGQSLRKLMLRGPFIKGPDDAPMIGGDRVWKVKPPQERKP